MKTSKPISTISYNSEKFLKGALNYLVTSHTIEFYAYIYHKPEDDEAGNKIHAHVFLQLAKMCQTEKIRDLFRELDPSKPDKPLGVLPFRKCNSWDDWYLYILHDPEYLLFKGQARHYHYEHEDISTSDPDELLCKARQVDLLSGSPYKRIVAAVKAGLSWDDFFRQGIVPVQQISQWEKAFYTVSENRTFRNGRPGHTPAEDNTIANVKSEIARLKVRHYDLMGSKLDDFHEIDEIEQRIRYLTDWLKRQDQNLERTALG